jgi:hypothetical protein
MPEPEESSDVEAVSTPGSLLANVTQVLPLKPNTLYALEAEFSGGVLHVKTIKEVRAQYVQPKPLTRHVSDYAEGEYHPLPSACCNHPIRRVCNDWVCTADHPSCTMAGCCARVGD